MKELKVMAMAFEKKPAELRVEALAQPLAIHLILLFGLSPNDDSHHWMNNGVLSVTSTIASLTYLTKGKRLKKGWLKRTLYTGYFSESHSLIRNTVAFLSEKPEYTPLLSRKSKERDFELLQTTLEQVYDHIIDLILTTDYTRDEEKKVRHDIGVRIKHLQSELSVRK